MPRIRSRLVTVPLTAVAAALTLTAAVQAGAAEPSAEGGTGSTSKAGAAASAPCLENATTLIGDIDGDGLPDRISNPGNDGTKMTVQFGIKGGSFDEKFTVAELVGANKGEETTAAVADFQNDGILDLVVNVIEPSGGDDPATARIAEYRPGPLDRTDLSSDDTVKAGLGERGEIWGLAVADYNGDKLPDLAIHNNTGDGTAEREVRLGQPGTGIEDINYDDNAKYGETNATWGEPPAMPTDGWSKFYKACA
ncbi:FG-GAP repeat domain-containing protein [Streptomyces sp. NPDC054796]